MHTKTNSESWWVMLGPVANSTWLGLTVPTTGRALTFGGMVGMVKSSSPTEKKITIIILKWKERIERKLLLSKEKKIKKYNSKIVSCVI